MPSAQKRAPRLLALDLGTVTGYAIGDAQEGFPVCGTLRLPRGANLGFFLLRFEEWLEQIFEEEEPRGVVVEAPLFRGSAAFSGPNQTEKLSSLVGIAAKECEKRRLRFETANILTVKKYFAGTGKADKDAMMQAAKALGFHVENHNEADAAAIFAWFVHSQRPDWAQRFFALVPTMPARRRG